jgi:hypothetical protein
VNPTASSRPFPSLSHYGVNNTDTGAYIKFFILKIKMINQIHDIYSEPNFIKTIVPFSELRSTMNHLLRNRDYHSQCTLEFYLILETLDLSKDSFTTRPLIKAMFNCKLTFVNFRVSLISLTQAPSLANGPPSTPSSVPNSIWG